MAFCALVYGKQQINRSQDNNWRNVWWVFLFRPAIESCSCFFVSR